ncbi:MAG: hypothetical protein V5804_13575 [Mucilaginibacter sp.]|uniref:hypothetical protein n=1 Tax=Mucilaginibacter sp. TaxID=1882438 RepID=UPI0034E4C85F
MPINLVCSDILRLQKDNGFYVVKEAWQISLTKFKQALNLEKFSLYIKTTFFVCANVCLLNKIVHRNCCLYAIAISRKGIADGVSA